MQLPHPTYLRPHPSFEFGYLLDSFEYLFRRLESRSICVITRSRRSRSLSMHPCRLLLCTICSLSWYDTTLTLINKVSWERLRQFCALRSDWLVRRALSFRKLSFCQRFSNNVKSKRNIRTEWSFCFAHIHSSTFPKFSHYLLVHFAVNLNTQNQPVFSVERPEGIGVRVSYHRWQRVTLPWN